MSKSTSSPKAINKKKTPPKSEGEKWDFTKPLRESMAAFRPADKRVRVLGLILLIILTALSFGWLLATSFSAMEKFLGGALIMFICGEAVRGWMDWDGFLGLILFKDSSTLGWIDRQARRWPSLWKVLANVGMVMGYGLCSFFLLGKEEQKPRRFALILAAGIPLLLIFQLFVAPTAYDALRDAIGVSELKSAGEHMRATAPLQGDLNFTIGGEVLTISQMGLMLFALMLAGGMAAGAWMSLVLYAAGLIPPLVNKLVSIVLGLAGHGPSLPALIPPPGGSPLLPGVNLPLLEGLIALSVLMVVHEMSHGLLARVHRIRLLTAGVAFYGILPFGAFVDPDEKELTTVPQERSNQVLVAGSASNMLTAIIGLMALIVLTLAFQVYVIWGGAQAFAQGSAMALIYGLGLFVFHFVGRCLGLIVALDYLVGIVNLLPVPLFDGHRLMEAGVRNKLAAKAITYVTLAAFVINFLPWIFR